MYKSLAKRANTEVIEVRWRMPKMVRDDMEVYARRLGLHGGELMTIAAIRLLNTLYDNYSQEFRSLVLPKPMSSSLAGKGFSLKDVLDGMREVPRR